MSVDEISASVRLKSDSADLLLKSLKLSDTNAPEKVKTCNKFQSFLVRK